jgi:formate dehydrogenase
VGRCDTAPVAVVGQNPVPRATIERVVSRVQGGETRHPVSDPNITPAHLDYAAYRAAGGYTLAASCVNGERTPADVIAMMEDSGLRGLGGAASRWTQVENRGRRTGSPLLAINIDEGEPGTFKTAITSSATRTGFSRVLSSPPGPRGSMTFISISATNTTGAARCFSTSSTV